MRGKGGVGRRVSARAIALVLGVGGCVTERDPPPPDDASTLPTPSPDAPAPAPPAPPAPDASTPPPAPPAIAGCTVTRPGATGNEKDGVIPVCCTPNAEDKAFVDEVFRLLNQHRMDNGRAPLAFDEGLARTIQGHCRHMAEHSFFDHEAPEPAVAEFTTRAKLCGTTASGENIAFNQATPAAVIRTWINSAGHNENMLSASYKRVGIGHFQRRWGQIFGR